MELVPSTPLAALENLPWIVNLIFGQLKIILVTCSSIVSAYAHEEIDWDRCFKIAFSTIVLLSISPCIYLCTALSLCCLYTDKSLVVTSLDKSHIWPFITGSNLWITCAFEASQVWAQSWLGLHIWPPADSQGATGQAHTCMGICLLRHK